MASKTIQHIYAAIAENPSCGVTTSYTFGTDDKDTTHGSVRVTQQTNYDDDNVEVAMRTDREVFSTSIPHFGSGSFIPPPPTTTSAEAMNIVPSSPQKEHCNMGSKKYSKESLKLTPDTSPESSLEYAISSIDGSNNTDEYGSGPHLPSLNEQDISFTNIGATTGLTMKKKSIYTTDAGGTFTQPNVITMEGQLGANNEGREQQVMVVVTKDSLSLGSSSMNNSSVPDSIELSREEEDDDIQHNKSNNTNDGVRQQHTVSEFMKTAATPFDELSHDNSSSQGSSSKDGSDKENNIKTFQRYPSDEALNYKKSTVTTSTTNTNDNRNASPIATTQMFTTEELSSITKLQMSTYLTLNERQSISTRILKSNLKECTVSTNMVCKECNMPLLIPKQKQECKEECREEWCLVCPELKKCVLQKILDGAASSTGGSTSGSILSNTYESANKKERSGTNETSNETSNKEEDNEERNQSQCKFLPTLPSTDNSGILQELQTSLLNVYNQSMQCQQDTTEYISSTTNKVYNQSLKCQADTTEYVATTTTDAIEEARQILVKNSKLECHEADFVTSTVDKGSEIMLGKLNRSLETSKSKEDTAVATNGSGKKRREDMPLASCNGLDFNEVKQCTIHAMELFTSSVTRQVQCKPSSSEVSKKCYNGQDTREVDSVVEEGDKNEKRKKSCSVSLLDQDDVEDQEDVVADNEVIVEDASEGDVEENGSSLLLGEGIDDEEEEAYDIEEVKMQPEKDQEFKKTEYTNHTIKDSNKQTSLMKTSLNIVRGIGSTTCTKSLTPNTSKALVTLVTQIEEIEEKMIKTKCMKEKRRCAELLEKLDGAAGVLKEVEENKV